MKYEVILDEDYKLYLLFLSSTNQNVVKFLFQNNNICQIINQEHGIYVMTQQHELSQIYRCLNQISFEMIETGSFIKFYVSKTFIGILKSDGCAYLKALIGYKTSNEKVKVIKSESDKVKIIDMVEHNNAWAFLCSDGSIIVYGYNSIDKQRIHIISGKTYFSKESILLIDPNIKKICYVDNDFYLVTEINKHIRCMNFDQTKCYTDINIIDYINYNNKLMGRHKSNIWYFMSTNVLFNMESDKLCLDPYIYLIGSGQIKKIWDRNQYIFYPFGIKMRIKLLFQCFYKIRSNVKFPKVLIHEIIKLIL
jgi:hypothetical protein